MTEILGVVAEYNPLHAGHLYQLHRAKKETGCNIAIIALSGNFVQRGEPALVPKRVRTAMALAAGADLVIEIPTALVLQSAQGFAQAGVEILSAAGTTTLSFGSESGSLEKLQQVARLLDQDPVQSRIAPLMKGGLTYARALQLALGSHCPEPDLVSKANNILGVEYLRAIKRLGKPLACHTVERIGPGHGNLSLAGFASATAIRRAVQIGSFDIHAMALPPRVTAPLAKALNQVRPVFLESLATQILLEMRRGDRDLGLIQGMGEGLEFRFQAAAAESVTLEDLIASVKTKRYPRTRIQRIICSALLGISPKIIGPVPYLRVLGFSPQGRVHLGKVAKGPVPLLVKAQDARELQGRAKEMLQVDLLAAAIHSVAGGYIYSSDLRFAPVTDH